MLKKIINDKNPEILNIIFFTMFFMFLFIIVLLPIVIFVASSNPNILDMSYYNVNGNVSELYKFLDVLGTIFEFLILGTIAEFIRRKKSLKFKIFDNQSSIFYIYFIVFQSFYIIINLIKLFIK